LSRPRVAGALLVLGCVAGIVAATASTWANRGACGPDPGGECFGLVRMLSVRVGLVTGTAAVLMVLIMAGLHRMVLLEEARRALDARSKLPG